MYIYRYTKTPHFKQEAQPTALPVYVETLLEFPFSDTSAQGVSYCQENECF